MKMTETEVLSKLDETVIFLNGYKVYMEFDCTNYYCEESSGEDLMGLYVNVDDKRYYGSLQYSLIYKQQKEDKIPLDDKGVSDFLDNIMGRINQHIKENYKELTNNIGKCREESNYQEELDFHKHMMRSVVNNTELILQTYN